MYAASLVSNLVGIACVLAPVCCRLAVGNIVEGCCCVPDAKMCAVGINGLNTKGESSAIYLYVECDFVLGSLGKICIGNVNLYLLVPCIS